MIFHRSKTGFMALSLPVLERVKKMNSGVGEKNDFAEDLNILNNWYVSTTSLL